MPNPPDLTVVICSHNRSQLLRQALVALARCARPPQASMEVLVVANNCSDDTLQVLESFVVSEDWSDLPLRWVEESRPGKSNALNRAIADTHASTLCFLDDDQFVAPSFLQEIMNALRTNPDVDIFCGTLHPAWDGSEPAWVHVEGPYRIPVRPFPEYDLGNAEREITLQDKLPSGGNIVVRRRVFASAGAFNTHLGPRGHDLGGAEDLDFLLRCQAKGHRIRYVPAIRQLHAIESERMATSYMLRKSYQRTLSSRLAHSGAQHGIRPYMVVKPVGHALRAIFTADSSRRFYFLMRLSAALGELKAAIASRSK